MFLKNYWYVAAESDEVGRRPLGRIILNEPIVMYRKADGTVAALEDRCCHRRAPLSKGELVGDAIQCGYHGFTFDASGACVRVPGLDSPPQNARVKSYPVCERHRWVWVWMGDARQADEALIPDFHQLDHPKWTAAHGVIRLEADYLLYVDNLMDLSHVGFVHRGTIGTDDSACEVRFERGEGFVRGTREAFDIDTPPLYRNLGLRARAAQKKIMTFRPPCHIWIDITTTEAGPDAKDARSAHVFVLNSMTPETERSCHYFWGSARDFDLGNTGMTELVGRQTIKAFNEDKDMVEAQQRIIALDPQARIVSVPADSGGLYARRLVKELGEREAAPA